MDLQILSLHHRKANCQALKDKLNMISFVTKTKMTIQVR
jgi:hypothetical protein